MKIDIKKAFNLALAQGFFRNSIFRFVQAKVFWRNRYVLSLVFIIFVINIAIWFIWAERIIVSGFAIESHLNFILNIPLVPRFYSLLFINYFVSLINMVIAFIVYKHNSFSSIVLLFGTIILNTSILAMTIYYIYNLKL